jgi:hypothetical protein
MEPFLMKKAVNSQLHETVADEESSEQCSVKRHRFEILNDISDLVLGCFYNLVIKPLDKLQLDPLIIAPFPV